MNSSRGRRFDEPKLNIKKVIALIVAIAVIAMVFVSIKNLLTKEEMPANVSAEKTYFSIEENGKWGVIDNLGEYVIKPEYDEMIVIPNKNKDVFICYESVDYEEETYNTKVINKKGELILSEYYKVEPIENYNESETWYEEDLLKYEEAGKFGIINLEGKKILEREYDNIYPMQGVEKSIIVEENGKKGLLNSNSNKLIIEPKYENIETLTKNYLDGYIVSDESQKFGIIDISGKIIFECVYDKIQNVYGNNMYVVSKDKTNYLVNSKGEEVLELGEKNVIAISTLNIVFEEADRYGVIDFENNTIIDAEYDYLKNIYENYYIAKKDGNYGIISIDGTTKLDFIYKNITYIEKANIIEVEDESGKVDLLDNNFETKLTDVIVSEYNLDKGYLRARINGDYKYYNFKFEEKTNLEVLPTNTLFLVKENGKYGYINKKGEKVVDNIYEDAKEQNEFGYCAVKKDGLWGCLKADGTVVVEPVVNLDDSLYINFISKWHLNNNINIYTK